MKPSYGDYAKKQNVTERPLEDEFEYVNKSGFDHELKIGTILHNTVDGKQISYVVVDTEGPSYKAAKLRVYSRWAGKPEGDLEDRTRCIESVYVKFDVIGHQCKWPRGHGPNGLYCKTHAKVFEEIKKEDKS